MPVKGLGDLFLDGLGFLKADDVRVQLFDCRNKQTLSMHAPNAVYVPRNQFHATSVSHVYSFHARVTKVCVDCKGGEEMTSSAIHETHV